MKTFVFLYTLFMLAHPVFGQIDFDATNGDWITNQNLLKADSAILAGEYGEVHSLLVIRNGRLVFEKYYNGWRADSLHQLQSATKSVVATLVGCALQQNLIKSADEKIPGFYPGDYAIGRDKAGISIADLMTQRHGLKWKESPWDDPENTWRKVLSTEGDWYKTILATEMDTLPGTVFNYSNAAPVLTAGIVQNASKMKIDDFAKKYLFDPLEIKNYRFWGGNGGPQNNGMALLSLTSRDMAKIGQLYLRKGQWNGAQILPEDFVQEAISPKVKNVEGNGFYSGYDYGYFWWSNPVSRSFPDKSQAGIFMARGAGGQNIIVWPEKEMVVVITAWNIRQSNKPQMIFDQYILNEPKN